MVHAVARPNRPSRRTPASRPAPAALARAEGGTIPDVLAPGLDVVFCGINPGRYSAAVGHHFARPGNRFWPALHLGGFTAAVLDPADDRSLLEVGCGLTNLVARATATAAELDRRELQAGAARLVRTVEALAPTALAVVGIGAYRNGFDRPGAAPGRQPRDDRDHDRVGPAEPERAQRPPSAARSGSALRGAALCDRRAVSGAQAVGRSAAPTSPRAAARRYCVPAW